MCNEHEPKNSNSQLHWIFEFPFVRKNWGDFVSIGPHSDQGPFPKSQALFCVVGRVLKGLLSFLYLEGGGLEDFLSLFAFTMRNQPLQRHSPAHGFALAASLSQPVVERNFVFLLRPKTKNESLQKKQVERNYASPIQPSPEVVRRIDRRLPGVAASRGPVQDWMLCHLRHAVKKHPFPVGLVARCSPRRCRHHSFFALIGTDPTDEQAVPRVSRSEGACGGGGQLPGFCASLSSTVVCR